MKRLTDTQKRDIAIMINSKLKVKESILWGEIIELVNTKYEIKNWLDVRMAMHMLTRAKLAKRDISDLNVERYLFIA